MYCDEPDIDRLLAAFDLEEADRVPNFEILIEDHHVERLLGRPAGHTLGATDELGMTAVEEVHHVRDFHVTLLRLLGLDDNRLTYYHAGRFKQLSQFGGQVIGGLIG